ncbi:MAG TPA: HAMP domain-containing histidine kinase, partial [Kiloniellaceae bacterium]|nr:HAMP domain-containing histidine kinase [Kiloniellaceae bacterium]
VRISDTGCGISDEHKKQIFDPFFTTKGVGKGTGQGLSIAYSSITQKHDGTISVESEVGVGTTFIIHLPVGEAETLKEAV